MNNTETINILQDQLRECMENVDNVKKQLAALKIDKQTVVKKEKDISPGIGCKVAYNAAGLITTSVPLESSDIPDLPIEKITGLSDIISELASRAELSRLSSAIESKFTPSIATRSGSKINIDRNGLVVGISDLLPEDIPSIPITKVSNLKEQLDLIKQTIPNDTPRPDIYNVKPGIGCKVTWDSKGRITGSTDLTWSDLPSQLISKIQTIESLILQNSDQDITGKVLDIIKKQIPDRANINPGIYTKLAIDSNGYITAGGQIQKSDLPVVEIGDIPELYGMLADRATKDEIIEISNKISQLQSSINVARDEVTALKVELTSVKRMLDELKSIR